MTLRNFEAGFRARYGATPTDIQAADSYNALQGLLKKIDTVNCKAIPKP